MTTEAQRHAGDPLFDAHRIGGVASDSMFSHGVMTRWLIVVLAVVIVAGGLFGYDQGVISGALPGIKADFSLSVLMVQVVTSWVTLGALVGSLAGGALSDQFGRRRTMLLAGALFTFGAAVQWSALGWRRSPRLSMPPNWRRQVCAAVSFRATNSRSRSASSWLIS